MNTEVHTIFKMRLALIALKLEFRWRTQGNARGIAPGLNETEERIDEFSISLLRETQTQGSPDGPLDEKIAELEEQIKKRVRAGDEDPLLQLSDTFGLDIDDQEMLMLCAAAQTEARFARFYALLQGDLASPYPTSEFFRVFFSGDIMERCGGQAVLFRTRILRFGDSTQSANPLPNFLPIILDQHILRFLTGGRGLDPRTTPILQVHQGPALTPWSAVHIDTALRAKIDYLALWNESKMSLNKMRLVILRAPDGSSGSITRGMAERLNLNVLEMNYPLLSIKAIDEVHDIVFHCLREVLMWNAVLYIPHIDTPDSKDGNTALLISFLESYSRDFPILTVLGTANPVDTSLQSQMEVLHVGIPYPSVETREKIWHNAVSTYDYSSDAPTPLELAQRFKFTETGIRDAVHFACNHALMQKGTDDKISREDILHGCRAQTNQRLSLLAEKVETKFRWEDLILPQEQARQLREAHDQAAHMEEVFKDWGFETTIAAGRGLNMLFSGPSGTGKTMAASIIAGELGLEMYKVDLATIVSKYIGETEKNLARIFHEAESSHAILFFDEADAMFGKRSEVQSAQDRFANIEVGYLLQRMEQYSGIIVLATNLAENIDEAFLRRLHFMIEFSLPEEKERLEIWRRAVPTNTRVAEDVDLPFLASNLRISGANIKNILLFAAFHAIKHGNELTMRDIVMGVRHEMQKESKPILRADLGEYYDLLAESDANE